ncbi:MAG: hypothetical protein GY809_24375 [Planctomycetes bacterium]|nr:hypothetical protein [Planctomycetota bacterium]
MALMAGAGSARADFIFGEPVNLGTPINSSSYDECVPTVSADGLSLYLGEWLNNRPGGYGGTDIWLSTRDTVDDGWGVPVNLGSSINTSDEDGGTYLSADGLVLYFSSSRPGGYGDYRHLFVDDNEVAVDEADLPGMENTGYLNIGTGQGFEEGTFWSGLIDDVRVHKQGQ